MRFTLTIDCDNAAFDEAPYGEIARILRDAAARIEVEERMPLRRCAGERWALTDSNGLNVGRCLLAAK